MTLEASEIHGSVTNVVVVNEAGSTIEPGEPLLVSFEYNTDTPGEFSLGIEVECSGGRREYLVHEPYLLAGRRGFGEVGLIYSPPRAAADMEIESIQVYLFPARGALGTREIATLPGPYRMEGTEIFSRSHLARIEKLEREVEELRRALARQRPSTAP